MADFTDFLPNVWRYATADSVLRSLVSAGPIGKDLGADDAYRYDPANNKFGWIFRDIGDQLPPRDIEGSSKAAVLFSHVGHWSNQTRFHTSKFPILVVSIFADITRDPSSFPGEPQEAEYKVRVVWREIDRLFHDAANKVHMFDALRIVSSVESSPLSIMDVPDGDGAVRGAVRYDITL